MKNFRAFALMLCLAVGGVFAWAQSGGYSSPATASISTAGGGTTNTVPKFTSGTALGNSSLSDNGTTLTLGESVGSYNSLVLAGQGVSLVRSNVASVGLVAAVPTTNLLTAIPSSARFRVSYYAVVSSAFTTAGLTVTIGWSDNVQAQTSVSSVSGTTVGSVVSGTVFLAGVAGTNITYATASTGTFGAYTLVVVVEQLT